MATINEKILPAILIAVGVAVAGWSVGEGLKSFRQADRSLTIKGLAEQDVKSDFALWTLSFRRAASNYDEVRRQLADDREVVVSFLLSQGFSEADIERRPLQITDLLARDFGQQDVTFRYTGQASVTVRSVDVDAVAKAATSIDPLIKQGVQMSQEGPMGGFPRYLLRGFNDIKPILLEKAVRNAAEQAQKFAADAGAHLGDLHRANQGTIQILDDDGGDGYATGQTIGKRLWVVSTFVYSLD